MFVVEKVTRGVKPCDMLLPDDIEHHFAATFNRVICSTARLVYV